MADPDDYGIDANAVEALGYNTEDVGLSLSLLDTALTLLDAANGRIDDLTARVAALEPAVFTAPKETP